MFIQKGLLTGAVVAVLGCSVLAQDPIVPPDAWLEKLFDGDATARLGYPVAVHMREERDLLVALLVDVSASLDFGYGAATKLEAVRRAASALAVTGVRSSDRVALVTFAAGMIDILRPASGPAQLERIFRALECEPAAGPTNAAPALAWAADTLPRHRNRSGLCRRLS